MLLAVAVSTGGGRPVRNSPENIGKAGRCHGAGSARSVGTDHKASTKPRPHSSSARWKGVAAPLRTAIPRRPSLRQFPPQAPMRRSEEHTSELQSLMRISYAVFCLQKKNQRITQNNIQQSSTNKI